MDLSQSTALTMAQIVETVRSLYGALVVDPAPGDPDVPELAWGDVFFYYAPDGRLPQNIQPYGTIITKNYPDDTSSGLDHAARWRVNIRVGREALHELTGPGPVDATAADPAATDVLVPHPVYGPAGWVCVINPGARTAATVLRLLRDAHQAARTRLERRG